MGNAGRQLESENVGAEHGREPVSVCVVCCDEAENIRPCLASVAWADEIVVVDSGSKDGTPAIAREFTSRVMHQEWLGYVEQKNFALDQASHEWVLCLDADERLSLELAQEIRAKLARIGAGGSDAAGYTMPRRTFYLGRWINHSGWYPNRQLRLFRRSAGRWGGVNPHDHVEVRGRIAHLEGDLLHHAYRDIADHVVTINRFTTIAARERLGARKNRALVHMLLNPVVRFLRMYLLQRGFLDGVPGLMVAVMGSYYVFLKYAKLWEMSRDPLQGKR